jgi:AraC-type DNA-binding domain-containing proteins
MKTDKYKTKFKQTQFMSQNDFELYYYSDLGFKSVEPHVHDFYEYYFPISSNISMQIKNHTYPLSTRSVILIPPMVKHRAVVNDPTVPYQRYVLWISKEYMKKLISISEDFNYLNDLAKKGTYIFQYSEDEVYTLHTLILRFLQENIGNRFGQHTFLQLILHELLMILARKESEHTITAGQTVSSRNDSDLIESMTAYIDRNLTTDLSLKSLSNHFFVSEDYISHLFAARLHVSPHQYVLSMRLAHARMILIAGRQINRAYLDCGFKDYSSFYRAFKKAFAVSPKELQKIYVNDPQKNR